MGSALLVRPWASQFSLVSQACSATMQGSRLPFQMSQTQALPITTEGRVDSCSTGKDRGVDSSASSSSRSHNLHPQGHWGCVWLPASASAVLLSQSCSLLPPWPPAPVISRLLLEEPRQCF